MMSISNMKNINLGNHVLELAETLIKYVTSHAYENRLFTKIIYNVHAFINVENENLNIREKSVARWYRATTNSVNFSEWNSDVKIENSPAFLMFQSI